MAGLVSRRRFASLGVAAISLAAPAAGSSAQQPATSADTIAIAAMARDLASDANRGRGPWTPENARVARQLAQMLEQRGAKPVFGTSLLVPFTTPSRPADTVFNVVGVFPNRAGATSGDLVGITAHLDHLGIGPPDAAGDSIYNGFLDDAVSIAMIFDVARRYVQDPGDRPLVVMFFNLEEQGLLGAKALAARADAAPFIDRLRFLIEVDAGSPAGEALAWQIMQSAPPNPGALIADSLARARGWTTTASAPRPISDVFVFAQRGVPIMFPIPGATWRGYTAEQRADAMRKFDHYHQPSDQWRPDFPWVGTAAYADWLSAIVQRVSRDLH